MKRLRKAICSILAMSLTSTLIPLSSLFAVNVNADVEVAINEYNFPDTAFRDYISESIDMNNNGSLSAEEIEIVTCIDVWDKNISSLKGIEYFTSLLDLSCGENNLTTLDVSQNTALNHLSCRNNRLTTLDVSKNITLNLLDCCNNQLTSLDVSKNTSLTDLFCGENQLTTLDVSNNTSLVDLYCSDNELTTLDVTNNTALTDLSCFMNSLSVLDVSKNTKLEYLCCYSNQLTTLDVCKNTVLTELCCYDNKLTNLDLSSNTALVNLYCDRNQLTALDVSHNSDLYYLMCGRNQLSTLDVSKNTALFELACEENQLQVLDVSKNTSLEHLICYSNQLSSLDVSNNPLLVSFECSYNQLSNLDVSNHVDLTQFHCRYNQLTELDLGANKTLERLSCDNNMLTTINVSGCSDLEEMYVQNNDLRELNLDGCTSLTTLDCSYNYLTVRPQVENLIFDPQKQSVSTEEDNVESDFDIASIEITDFDMPAKGKTPDHDVKVTARTAEGKIVDAIDNIEIKYLADCKDVKSGSYIFRNKVIADDYIFGVKRHLLGSKWNDVEDVDLSIRIDFNVVLKDEFCFASDKCKVSINDNDVSDKVTESTSNDLIAEIRFEDASDLYILAKGNTIIDDHKTPITTIEVTGLDKPTKGSTPDQEISVITKIGDGTIVDAVDDYYLSWDYSVVNTKTGETLSVGQISSDTVFGKDIFYEVPKNGEDYTVVVSLWLCVKIIDEYSVYVFDDFSGSDAVYVYNYEPVFTVNGVKNENFTLAYFEDESMGIPGAAFPKGVVAFLDFDNIEKMYSVPVVTTTTTPGRTTTTTNPGRTTTTTNPGRTTTTTNPGRTTTTTNPGRTTTTTNPGRTTTTTNPGRTTTTNPGRTTTTNPGRTTTTNPGRTTTTNPGRTTTTNPGRTTTTNPGRTTTTNPGRTTTTNPGRTTTTNPGRTTTTNPGRTTTTNPGRTTTTTRTVSTPSRSAAQAPYKATVDSWLPVGDGITFSWDYFS